MKTKSQLGLSGLPVCIDPLCNLLEVKAREMLPDGSAPDPRTLRWVQLHRLFPDPEEYAFPASSGMVHFFGDGPCLSACSTLLAYDATGFLRARIDRDGDGFWGDPAAYPEEVTGRPCRRPSVRLVFGESSHAREFNAIVRMIREGGYRHTHGERLAELVQHCLEEPPRQLPVSVKEETT